MSIRTLITALFKEVAAAQRKQLAPLSGDLRLTDSGLDSLGFALIVARLEDELGFDPFDGNEAIAFPVTFGDFLSLYERKAT